MINRRDFLERCAAAGIGQTLLPGALAALAVQSATAQATFTAAGMDTMPAITPEMLDAAAAIAGITLSTAQRTMMLDGVKNNRAGLQAIRDLHMPNSVAPAVIFDPLPMGASVPVSTPVKHVATKSVPVATDMVSNEEKLAFATIPELGTLLRSHKITAVDLVKFYRKRIDRLNPKLMLEITATTERALQQAAQLDRELAAGKDRGPLHGIPWGAKDLLSVKGYPTTWGANTMETQAFDEDATVVQRLDAAGAILISKLTLGALAQNDMWFGGKTRNPWNTKQGASGSSAGPASAVSAGCCAFAIGSETLGSISAPSTRCGVTGLRPTYGFVPRTGAMALSWSMDKLGPICHSVEDAALVMQAIAGPDGKDLSVRPATFAWDSTFDIRKLRVGYLESAFAEPTLRAAEAGENAEAAANRQRAFERTSYDHKYDTAALEVLRGMGIKLIPVKLPDFPYGSVTPVLQVEAAAAFDEFLRTGRDTKMNVQTPGDWPNTFHVARMYSGVDYVQAMRARSLLIEKMAVMFADVDVIVTPTGGSAQLTATNLSGHPAVIVPNGLRGADAPAVQDSADGARGNTGGPGTPVSLTFLGRLYEDAKVLAFAQHYQQKTTFHTLHPQL
jgi:Asp-tRNA(Asn)/Glu-tRNA(Gln) amidotransferase A subunit family amidase